MPTAVLKIPVDDADFQKFLEAFKRYQGDLTDQPKVWSGINEGIDASAQAGQALADAIEHQVQRTLALADAERAINRVMADRADTAKRHEEDSSRSRRSALDHLRSVRDLVSTGAGHLGGFATGGGGGSEGFSLLGKLSSMVGGAGGEGLLGAGLGVIGGMGGLIAGLGGAAFIGAKSIADRNRTATGLNVSMGQLAGNQAYLDPFIGNTQQILGSMSTGASTPGSPEYVALMQAGIDPRGKDPSQLMHDYVLKAHDAYQQANGNMNILNARGYGKVLSVEQLRNIGNTDSKTLEEQFKAANDFAQNDTLSRSDAMKSAKFEAGVTGFADVTRDKLLHGGVEAASDVASAFSEGIKNAPQAFARAGQAVGQVFTPAIRESAKALHSMAAGIDGMLDRIINKYEGGAKVITDQGGLTKYGIASNSHSGVDVRNLSREQAVEIYQREYVSKLDMTGLGHDASFVALDAAINGGVGSARKLIAHDGDNAAAMIAERRAFYAHLAKMNPRKYGGSLKGWNNRLDHLSEDLVAYDTANPGASDSFMAKAGAKMQITVNNHAGASVTTSVSSVR